MERKSTLVGAFLLLPVLALAATNKHYKLTSSIGGISYPGSTIVFFPKSTTPMATMDYDFKEEVSKFGPLVQVGAIESTSEVGKKIGDAKVSLPPYSVPALEKNGLQIKDMTLSCTVEFSTGSGTERITQSGIMRFTQSTTIPTVVSGEYQAFIPASKVLGTKAPSALRLETSYKR